MRTPPGFKEAWRKLFDLGPGVVRDADRRGRPRRPARDRGDPPGAAERRQHRVQHVPGLTHGAADVIQHFALAEDKQRFLPHMIDGRFSGTMCLSEPHAGSDVGATTTTREADRRQPLRDQRHEVLDLGRRPRPGREHRPPRAGPHRGRARRAPRASRSSSCRSSGSTTTAASGEPNDVTTGIDRAQARHQGSATAVLNFGESGACRGILVGGQRAPGHASRCSA